MQTITLYAVGAVTEGQWLKYSDTGGYANADSSDTAIGMVAVESRDASTYFTAAIQGIVKMCHSAAINPGGSVKWSDTDTVAPADCIQNAIGIALQGSGDSVSTRLREVYFYGQGHRRVALT
jgi:hypothetical protein